MICAECCQELPHSETKANHCLKKLTERMERIAKETRMMSC